MRFLGIEGNEPAQSLFLSLILAHSYDTQHFSGVYRGRLVEHRVLNRDQQLIVPAPEAPGQRMIAGLHNHSFPNHVPELLLSYPVFLAVVAYDQGSFFNFHIRPTVSEFSRAGCVQFVPTKSDHGAPHECGIVSRRSERGKE
jgi:hypothetical protein